MDAANPETAADAPRADWTRRTFASLARPNFRLFFLGQGVSLAGSWMASAAEAWLVYQLTGSKKLLGLTAAVSMLPLAFLAPLGGVLADRMPKRRILAMASLLNAFISLVLAALVFDERVQVWQVISLAALSGCVFAIEMPVRQAFLVEMVGKESLLNAISLNTFLFNITRVLGPGAAGFVILLWGTTAWCFLIDGTSFLAVFAVLLAMRIPLEMKAPPEEGFRQRLVEGFRYVARAPGIKVLIALLVVSMLFGHPYLSQMAAFAEDDLRVGSLGYGLLLSANGGGAVIGALWLAGLSDAFNRRKLVLRMQSLFGATLVGLSFVKAPHAAGLVMAAAGFSMVTFFSTSNALIQADVPDALRGRVLGVWALVFGASLPAGQLLMGYVADRLGVPLSIRIGGAVCLVFPLLLSAARRTTAAPALA